MRHLLKMMTDNNFQKDHDRPREECGVFAVYGHEDAALFG
jgi:hypothetical protein